MSDVLDQWHYFASPVYSIKKPEFLDIAKTVSNDFLRVERKQNKMNEVYPIVQVDIASDARLAPFLEYVINTAWNLLNDQGYMMHGLSTYFTEIWCQEHHKYSSMDYHHHGDCNLIAFYFLECPKDPPRMVVHDPRIAKTMMGLPEANPNNLTLASPAVNFVPEPGTLMFANSWLPHSFTRNTSTKPFKFIHMNIATRVYVEEPAYEPTAEVI